MTHVTAVDPHWLADIGSVFYSIRQRNTTSSSTRATRDLDFSKKAQIEEQFANDIAKRRKQEEAQEAKRASRDDVVISTPGAATPRRGRRVGLLR